MLPTLTLVLGGAASGKSQFAENLLISSGLKPLYLATGQALDGEMQAKINVHQNRRGPEWSVIEQAEALDGPLSTVTEGSAVLIDCATMWLSQQLLSDQSLDDSPRQFLAELSAAKTPVVVVSNEVGQGIVPDHEVAREFREAQGRLNIAIARQSDLAVQVVAGLPNVLKGQLP